MVPDSITQKVVGLKRVRGRLRKKKQNEEPENKRKETASQSRRIFDENCKVKTKGQLLDTVIQYDEICVTKQKGQLRSTVTQRNSSHIKITPAARNKQNLEE